MQLVSQSCGHHLGAAQHSVWERLTCCHDLVVGLLDEFFGNHQHFQHPCVAALSGGPHRQPTAMAQAARELCSARPMKADLSIRL